MRVVVLLCGPPGAGKTTAARQSGLLVYDRDDPHWTDERSFHAALTALGATPDAQAVVIRAGATSSARGAAAAAIQATHVYLLTGPRKELERRVAHRDRARRSSLAAIKSWFDRHDLDDHVQPFPGWDAIGVDTGTAAAPTRCAYDPGPTPGW